MSGAETPHAVRKAQHGNWAVGLTDVPADWLPIANARCLHHASPAGFVPQPLGYLVAKTTNAHTIEGILFGTVGFEVRGHPETDRRADIYLKNPFHEADRQIGRPCPRQTRSLRRTAH